MDEPSDQLTISQQVATDGRTVELRLVGEIDMATAPLVEDALSSAIVAERDLVMIDLSGVDFMDSSGLNALINGRNRLGGNGAKLVISGMSDQVRRLFELSGLMTVFTFAPS